MANESLTSRKLFVEDLQTTNQPGTTIANVQVWGAGAMTLTPIPITLLTQLVVAVSDGAAATAGVAVGEVYVSSPTMKLRTRMA